MKEKGHKCHGGCNREAENAARKIPFNPTSPNHCKDCGGPIDDGDHCPCGKYHGK